MNYCETCQGNGWVVTSRGAKRCTDCISEKPIDQRERIDERSLAQAVKALSVLAFFPVESAALAVIGEALSSMCPNVPSLRYVVSRACTLYRSWDKCGIPGLRQIVCSRYRPADGIESGPTDAYPMGLPADPTLPHNALLSGSPLKRIGPDDELSGDLEFDRKLRLLAHTKDLNVRLRKKTPEPPSGFKLITAADIERAVQENRDRKAREELVLE